MQHPLNLDTDASKDGRRHVRRVHAICKPQCISQGGFGWAMRCPNHSDSLVMNATFVECLVETPRVGDERNCKASDSHQQGISKTSAGRSRSVAPTAATTASTAHARQSNVQNHAAVTNQSPSNHHRGFPSVGQRAQTNALAAAGIAAVGASRITGSTGCRVS